MLQSRLKVIWYNMNVAIVFLFQTNFVQLFIAYFLKNISFLGSNIYTTTISELSPYKFLTYQIIYFYDRAALIKLLTSL